MTKVKNQRSTFGHLTRAAAVLVACSGPVFANGFIEDVGSSERVNLSGQLGALSERITAAACNLSAGVAVTEAQAVLRISTNHFGRINAALVDGNRGFGILGEEKRPQTLQALQALTDAWDPLQQLANAMQPAANDTDSVAQLATKSDPVQQAGIVLVSEITGQYADPAVMQHADAMLIEIAGRQRILANRMSKNVCLIVSDVQDDDARQELEETIGLFEASMQALQNGMPNVGIQPPPTTAIAEGLSLVSEEWTALRPVLDVVLSGGVLTEATRARVFLAFLGMEARMNNVVHQYQKNSKNRL